MKKSELKELIHEVIQESKDEWRRVGSGFKPSGNVYLYKGNRSILSCQDGVDPKDAEFILKALNNFNSSNNNSSQERTDHYKGKL